MPPGARGRIADRRNRQLDPGLVGVAGRTSRHRTPARWRRCRGEAHAAGQRALPSFERRGPVKSGARHCVVDLGQGAAHSDVLMRRRNSGAGERIDETEQRSPRIGVRNHEARGESARRSQAPRPRPSSFDEDLSHLGAGPNVRARPPRRRRQGVADAPSPPRTRPSRRNRRVGVRAAQQNAPRSPQNAGREMSRGRRRPPRSHGAARCRTTHGEDRRTGIGSHRSSRYASVLSSARNCDRS